MKTPKNGDLSAVSVATGISSVRRPNLQIVRADGPGGKLARTRPARPSLTQFPVKKSGDWNFFWREIFWDWFAAWAWFGAILGVPVGFLIFVGSML